MAKNTVPDTDLVNEQIRAKNVRLIGDDGKVVGIIPRSEAIERARKEGLDLLLVAEDVDPPVCKIVDYGKYKYDRSRRERAEAAKARANQISVREIQMTPNISQNDIEIKAKKAREFLIDGDKVKVKVKFRGREITHTEKGHENIMHFIRSIGLDDVIFEKEISVQGRDMIAILAKK